jgi:plasmid stabilization system protein ParE
MSRSLRIVQRARTDADDIFNWLVRRSIRGAISWYLAFGQAIGKIQAAPESYARAPESQPPNCELRQAFFKTRRGRRYRLVFQMDENSIVILRVRGPGQAPLRRRDLPSE